MYGNTWASQYGTAASGSAAETWGAALAGLTPAQLADGLRACVAEGREFPPNAPRFRSLCFGVPSLDRVLLEVRKPDTASQFTRVVYQHVDGYTLRHASEDRVEQLITRAYNLVRETVMKGEPLPPAPIAALDLKPPPAPKYTPGVAEARLAEIRRILEPTAEERAEAAEKERQAEENRRIAAELANRTNEPAPLPDEPAGAP
ncbi:hypothetical protein [Lysobacter capsici]|uniref:hypothetical protein n=1 Tax=Lysobacter capsici TaxID=435897 RepID=UPI001C00551A|nr:hypothetical protein [Lysobacter capsici]QWF19280.1 hypothetical protein KME82_11340 [Lysobacter capsici]